MARASYSQDYQDRVTAAYIACVAEKDKDMAKLLRAKTKLDDIADKAKRMQAYRDFWQGLDERTQLDFSCHDARINTIARAIRTMAVTDVVQAHNAIKSTTAGSIDYVIRRFREENLTSSQVQQFIDENAVAWFSLTSHPTNPATVAYSLAEIALARVLSEPQSTSEDLKSVLRLIRDVPIVADRKTPADEVYETLGTLEVVYDVALRHKALFDKALAEFGYDKEGVRITKPLIHACDWSDGDGNVNITAQALDDHIAIRRNAIRTRYLSHLVSVRSMLGDMPPVIERKFKSIETAFRSIDPKTERLPDQDGLVEQIEDLAQSVENEDIAVRLNDLCYLVRCFGFCFGTIDIRHNAVDLMETAGRVLQQAGIISAKDFDALSPLEKESRLAQWLAAGDIMGQCQAVYASSLIKPDDEGSETAARIFERLQIVGRHPDICEKLIIAETVNAAHALCGLFLLKAAGNEIATQKSRIDLVTLSESVADLMGIGKMLESMLENETYRAHVVARGRMISMVAKSDTTRLDGRGAAEYAQYEAAVTTFGIIDRLKGKYPELEYVLTSVMNGGGLALQRGGGRVTEVPALHGRAAADARANDIGPSTLTIQGHQQRIMFAPYKTAIGTLEALAAQNLYSKAGIQGEMPPPVQNKHMNRQYARLDAWVYARNAEQAYQQLAKNNPAVDELLVAAPWLSMKAGNASSRPAKRGEKMTEPGITPREAVGKNPKALQGRAISGERLTAHACLPVFTLLGLAEGMQAVQMESQAALNPEKYGDPLYHLYRSNKIHRDGARVNINAVPIADFDIAWPLLIGRPRPLRDEVLQLAKQFRETAEPHANPPEVTLAFLEDYFLTVEKLTYEMVTGQKAGDDFRHGDGLKKLWPELAEQVEYQNRGAEFARVIEAMRTRTFNDNPDVPVTETQFRITQALYTAADVVDAPSGILATRTRLEPVKFMKTGSTRFARPESFSEKAVRSRLSIPECLKIL